MKKFLVAIFIAAIIFITGVQVGIKTGRNLEKEEAVERAIKKSQQLRDLLKEFEEKGKGQEASQQKKEVTI